MNKESEDIEARTTWRGQRQNRERVAQTIVGMDDVIDEMMISIFARGHCLLVWCTGLKNFSEFSGGDDVLKFKRIQLRRT